MQPIHNAASIGQQEVIIELIQQFGVDPREKTDVCIHIWQVWEIFIAISDHNLFREVCSHCTMLHAVVDLTHYSFSLKYMIFHLIPQQMYVSVQINYSHYSLPLPFTLPLPLCIIGRCPSTTLCCPLWSHWCGKDALGTVWSWCSPDIWCNNIISTFRYI